VYGLLWQRLNLPPRLGFWYLPARPLVLEDILIGNCGCCVTGRWIVVCARPRVGLIWESSLLRSWAVRGQGMLCAGYVCTSDSLVL
jgi:hypothetical protein